ncbi:hypothetical protein C0J52_12278 [Blattella germanica]|nr:hypothetical protein C0J52_12278 [Blattella germanica]
MDMDTYIYLLELVTPHIKKENTCMRAAISPHERLTATLRFLATGRSYKDLEFTTIISKQSLSEIIPETCEAIYKVLKKDYLKLIKRLVVMIRRSLQTLHFRPWYSSTALVSPDH